MKKRSEAEISTTWKLEDMVPDNETWEKQLKEASGELEKYGEFKGKLAESAENLYQCLKFDDEFSLKAERLYVYARMRSDEDYETEILPKGHHYVPAELNELVFFIRNQKAIPFAKAAKNTAETDWNTVRLLGYSGCSYEMYADTGTSPPPEDSLTVSVIEK